MNKRKLFRVILAAILLLNLFVILYVNLNTNNTFSLGIEIQSDRELVLQVFYSNDTNYLEEQSQKHNYSTVNRKEYINFNIPNESKFIRIDFGEDASLIEINGLYASQNNYKVDLKDMLAKDFHKINMIDDISFEDSKIKIATKDVDPYVVLSFDKIKLNEKFESHGAKILLIKKIIICVIIDILLIFTYIFSHKLLAIPKDILRNRNLIFYLAKNDFKTRYATSYFGVFWAFIQPVITIGLYWFVFQVGFRSSTMNDIPFVLWLIAGLVPWFYYSDVISSTTNCLIEYSYLVKKVVFNISILPVVKIISAFFVHLFFITFVIILYWCYGYQPNFYTIQLLYYTICMISLVLSISYISCSIVLFFRDLSQIINIYLQIAMWMTPIMWNHTMISDKLLWIFKINPMYYIVEGYRDSLINKVWFFEKFDYTLYFWIFVFITFLVGNIIFKKLRPHFADVI